MARQSAERRWHDPPCWTRNFKNSFGFRSETEKSGLVALAERLSPTSRRAIVFGDQSSHGGGIIGNEAPIALELVPGDCNPRADPGAARPIRRWGGAHRGECQSRLFRAKREASIASTTPTLREPISAIWRSIPTT